MFEESHDNLGGSLGTSGELVELQGARRTSAEPGELPGNFWGARGTSGDLGEPRGSFGNLREIWGSSVQPRGSSGELSAASGELGGVRESFELQGNLGGAFG